MTKRGKPPKIPITERPAWAQRLIAARIARNFSQTDVGKKINQSQSAIAAWENGQNEPDIATFKRLANILRVTDAWLILGYQRGLSEIRAEFGEPDLPDIPDETYSDAQFADVMIAVKNILVSENMKSDDKTVIELARAIMREIETFSSPDLSFEDKLAETIEIRRKALAAAKRLAFGGIRY